MSELYEQIYAIVKLIPKGRVMSYGGVARQLGRPSLPRVVGYALNALPVGKKVPWWRVINSQGRISNSSRPDSQLQQREHLEAEGVIVSDDYHIDLTLFDGEQAVYEKLRRKSRRAAASASAST